MSTLEKLQDSVNKRLNEQMDIIYLAIEQGNLELVKSYKSVYIYINRYI